MSIYLFVAWVVSRITQITEWTSTKLGSRGLSQEYTPSTFGLDPDKETDPGFSPTFSHCINIFLLFF